ncbi:energy-coupling factor ABC transporter substrate-binding protein [Methanolobus sp. ZRKC3]|uniref:energy-coupling factor ABC transporter substrate-binding protein n=1 Tax=Methanolobus sp. ZRKC3 TaxID=3125786 RepID=UPI00324B84F7
MKLEYIVGIVVLLFAVQFFYGIAANPGSEFGGADGQAEDVIAEVSPGYEPWFEGIGFEPPGGETESLLFALQAAFGAVVIGYTIGFYKGKGESNN